MTVVAKKHQPRAGSLAFYPRKRAFEQTPRVSFIKTDSAETKPINFMGYKAGMLHVMGVSAHKGSPLYGQETAVPATVIECPPVKVMGVRAYGKTPYGSRAIFETSENTSKHLQRRIKSFRMKHNEKKKAEAKGSFSPGFSAEKAEELDKIKEKISELRLICHTQPYETGMGKKKPDVYEVGLSGGLEKQIAYAKEKFGKEIKVSELFKEKGYVDIKAVTKGKGFQGVIKRHGVTIQPRKAKNRRVVGSIGPWHPPLVMWTVARPGQMGYHTRTEYNKRVLRISDDTGAINPASGFTNYGLVKNEYVLLSGTVAGAIKRAVALRIPTREVGSDKFNLSEIKSISTAAEKKKGIAAGIEESAEQKVKAHKMEKKE